MDLLGRQFSEFEIFRAEYKGTYLQKYFFIGKLVAPFQLTPSTM
jgi:hypothetical protein